MLCARRFAPELMRCFTRGGADLRIIDSIIAIFCTHIVTALSPIVVSDGSNLTQDLAAVAPVLASLKLLVTDFLTFLPTLKLAVADIAADTK